MISNHRYDYDLALKDLISVPDDIYGYLVEISHRVNSFVRKGLIHFIWKYNPSRTVSEINLLGYCRFLVYWFFMPDFTSFINDFEKGSQSF